MTSDPEEKGEKLLLPPPDETQAQQVAVNGPSMSLLDSLGPTVVNTDGTLTRIANWSEMGEQERERTIRILTKRNAERLAKLREQDGNQDPPQS